MEYCKIPKKFKKAKRPRQEWGGFLFEKTGMLIDGGMNGIIMPDKNRGKGNSNDG